MGAGRRVYIGARDCYYCVAFMKWVRSKLVDSFTLVFSRVVPNRVAMITQNERGAR